MSHNPHSPYSPHVRPPDRDEPTEFEVARMRRLDRINKLRAERRRSRPPRLYTRVALVTAGVALLDWVAVAFHTATGKGHPIDSLIGTHQALVATLSIIASCLGIGWVVMYEQCRQERQRDEIEELRYQDRVAMTDWASSSASNREWVRYAAGFRDGHAAGFRDGQHYGDAPTDPHGAIVPFEQRTGGSRNPGRFTG